MTESAIGVVPRWLSALGEDKAQVFIDPEMAELAALLDGPAAPSITNTPARDVRALFAQMAPKGGPEMARVEDRMIGGVPVRDYLPVSTPPATILFIHGGGWVVGSVEDYDLFARTLAQRTSCRVVSVDYRLAPENPFPAAVDDVRAVMAHLDATGPLFVAGDSAGGNLSAVLAQDDRDGPRRLAGQILIYPSVAGATDSPAMQEFDPPFMKLAEIRAFYDLYVPDHGRRADPQFAPAQGRLENLAPALVITASADLLAAEGRAYADAIEAAGCAVTRHEQYGALHAFLTLAPASTAADVTLDRITTFIDASL